VLTFITSHVIPLAARARFAFIATVTDPIEAVQRAVLPCELYIFMFVPLKNENLILNTVYAVLPDCDIARGAGAHFAPIYFYKILDFFLSVMYNIIE